jgi:hypothetical protein
MGGWMGGWVSRVKDCLHQSKINNNNKFELGLNWCQKISLEIGG